MLAKRTHIWKQKLKAQIKKKQKKRYFFLSSRSLNLVESEINFRVPSRSVFKFSHEKRNASPHANHSGSCFNLTRFKSTSHLCRACLTVLVPSSVQPAPYLMSRGPIFNSRIPTRQAEGSEVWPGGPLTCGPTCVLAVR